jgi:hypothetical protein
MPLRITGTVFVSDSLADTVEAEELLPPPVTLIQPKDILLSGLEGEWRSPGSTQPALLVCCTCGHGFEDPPKPEMGCLLVTRKAGNDMEGLLIHQRCLAGRLIKNG